MPGPCRPESFRILLDIGHTQTVPGAISARGVPEYLFNFELAQIIVARLHAAGFTAADSKGRLNEDLTERARDLNALKPDLVVSIHHDSVQKQFMTSGPIDGVQRSYSNYAAGYSIFVSYENRRPRESEAFALQLGAAMAERGQRPTMHHAEKIPGEGRPTLNAEYGVFRYDRLAVLRLTTMPAVLFEAAVIAHPDDELRAASAEYRALVADAFAQAVAAFCDNPRGAPSRGTDPQPTTPSEPDRSTSPPADAPALRPGHDAEE
jgi:N-acetylmuramoyl-L-alanine amidase